ncbi:MAG: pitrilysin family protein [Candidatus Curtissbacteria bacterium]|nr:pitrilysin family protein [Candidatus Curtissbacteria bacterium]
MNKKSYSLHKLKNGLVVIFQNMPSAYSVSAYLAVGAGSRYENKQTRGMAHFLEHMLFEGTERFPTSMEVNRQIEEIGGKSGAWTDKEHVIYYAKVNKNHLEILFDHLSEIIFRSTFEKAAIEKEKGIVFEELKRKKDNPEFEIWDLWSEFVWGKNHFLGNSILGDRDSIKSITREKLVKYLKDFYQPSNMVLTVVGDFSLPQAKNFANRYFGRIPNKSLVRKDSSVAQITSEKVRLVSSDNQQVQMVLGFLTEVSLVDKDRFIMEVLASFLTGGVSSRLFHRIVYELGISYYFGAGNWSFSDTGFFYVNGGFSSENIDKAIASIVEEIRRLKKEEVSKKELFEAKEKAKAMVYFMHETTDTLAEFYARQQILEGRVLTLDEIAGKITEVSVADIIGVARKYFVRDKLHLILRGPLKGRSEQDFKKYFKLV